MLTQLEQEIEDTRNKLMTLEKQRDPSCIAPMSKEPPRISVGVSREEFTEIQELARRCNTSISALGQLALKHLLIQSRAGALPMLPPSRVENAIEVTVMGNYLPSQLADPDFNPRR